LIDKSVSPQVFGVLRKMKPIRQIEAAEHMVAGGTYTIPFAKALLAVTKPGDAGGSDRFLQKARGDFYGSTIDAGRRKWVSA
jgi:hypothetical protein